MVCEGAFRCVVGCDGVWRCEMECAEVCDGMLRCVVSGELVSVLLAATTGLRPLCRKKMAFWSAGPKCGGLAEISGLTPRRINVYARDISVYTRVCMYINGYNRV